MEKKRSTKFLLWVLLAMLLAGGLYWALRPKPILVEIAEARRGPYEQQVIEEGKTRAKEIYKVLSPVAGNLRRVRLHPGDAVKEGDLLAEIDRPGVWPIKSPVAGTVLRVQRESGGPIERGDLILEVADPKQLEVVSEVLTEDALGIKPGDPVRMESWGECRTLEGRVRRVEPGAFTKVSALGIEEQRVNVIIDFNGTTGHCEGLADGFRLNNYITTFRAEDALTIPVGALFRDGRDWAVFQVVGGRARKTKVEVERRNPESALLKSGLKPGDFVVVYPSDELTDGARVVPMNPGARSS
ncbi:efflux RND transporter periplasmic adaptor subunit [Deltaproteobacteria bacterium PRO3]|nr:efflux RND transporter periplasmic adaptor subunit [Deltaproteobacteria bacterium PRO3]